MVGDADEWLSALQAATAEERARQLLNLAGGDRVASLVNEIVRRDDPVAGASVLGCLQYNQTDEISPALEPLFPLLATHFLRFLEAIATRQLEVRAAWDPKSNVGYLPYRLGNGWELTVYNRVYQWHYVSSFTSPRGDEIDLDLYPRQPRADRHPFEVVSEYEPPIDVLTGVYGF